MRSQRATQTPFVPAASTVIDLCPEGTGVHHLRHAHVHQRLPLTSNQRGPLFFDSGCCSGTAPGGRHRVGTECSSASPAVPHCNRFLWGEREKERNRLSTKYNALRECTKASLTPHRTTAEQTEQREVVAAHIS